MSGITQDASLDHVDVAYVARLARLALTPEETALFQGQLEHVLGYVRKIRELDLSGVEPTSHAVAVSNRMRADAARPGLDREAVLRNAPSAADGQIVVPRIVE